MTTGKRLDFKLTAGRALRRDAGQEIVEMAFVLSILLLVLIGIISFGRAYNIYQTVTRAAREGARMVVLTACATCSSSGSPCSSTGITAPSDSCIQSKVVNPALAAANLDPTNPTYTQSYQGRYLWLDNNNPPQECGVEISFTYPFQVTLPFTSLNLTTLNLHTQVQMRLENQPIGTGGNPPPCSGSIP